MTKHDILKKYFGYSSFRTGQEAVIDTVLAGRDVLAVMPTGAGKSICYQVPALLMNGITLVVSPLISLMKDQVQALNQAGIHAAYINSSLSETQIAKALRLAANGQYKIIYVAPERLETYGFLQFARYAEISMLTVDEAHCISQWGQDFRPSYLKIVEFIRQLDKRPIISAFTATATREVKEDIGCVLGLREPGVFVTGFDRKNLYFGVETTRKKDAYVLDYVETHKGVSGIIYCATRKNVNTLYERLLMQGIAVTRYHAGLSNEERRQNQEDFIYDISPVMVATNAFGMGIDKSNVRYVLHYNMPQSLENYYQEAGRAGRDGEPSECILLYSAQDLVVNRYLLEHKEDNEEFDEEQKRAVWERDEQRLQTMNNYCLTSDCLRRYILRYFGETLVQDCGNCSNCQQEYEEQDVTEQAAKIIQCIRQMRQRYGINVVAGTLVGDDRAKLREYNVSAYEAYGSLSDLSEAGVKQIINLMLVEQILRVTPDRYALLKLTAQADEVLEGSRRMILKRPKAEPKQEESNTKRARGSMRKSDILNSRGLELFEQLRELRTAIAREEGMPPYIIFSDKTLVDMCMKAPLNKEGMLFVNGVGENKYQKYGERFLQKIQAFTGGKSEKLYFGELGEMQNGGFPAASEGTGVYYQASKKKSDFFLTKEQAELFPYKDRYLAAELAGALNGLRNPATTKKTSGAEIYRLMQAKNYAKEVFTEGRYSKEVTPEGEAAGLILDVRISKAGSEYMDIYYGRKAQRFVVEYFVK